MILNFMVAFEIHFSVEVSGKKVISYRADFKESTTIFTVAYSSENKTTA